MDLLRSDLETILNEIRVMEAFNAAVLAFPTAANDFSQPTLEEQRVIMLGLVGNNPASTHGIRTTAGVLNNLTPGNASFGAADQPFTSLTDTVWVQGSADTDPTNPGMQGFGIAGAGAANANYRPNATEGNNVVDTQPRQISQLISDQSTANPAARAASDRTGGGIVMYGGAILEDERIPNTNIFRSSGGSLYNADGQVVDEVGNPMLTVLNNAPDAVSAPYNSWLTLFGQGFDHGLDHINKGGNGSVYIPLLPTDPLYKPGARTNFMVVTRAAANAVNTTTPWIDMNQAYGSNPSFQVFLREYTLVDGKPVATGKLLGGTKGGMPTWADIKFQAATKLGIQLTDAWVKDSPMVATDQFGKFIPDALTGMPMVVFNDPSSPSGFTSVAGVRDGIGISLSQFGGAVATGHAFLLDIAHTAAPDGKPADTDEVLGTTNPVSNGRGGLTTYDNELLDAHFIAGDGRVNENSGLTTFHTIFHNEHDRLVADYKRIALESGDVAFLNEWLNTSVNDIPVLPAEVDALNWNGERLFQAARFMVEMQYQHGVFEEFARFMQPNLNVFGGIATDLNPDIFREFAHAVYRFGHSMLNETVDRVTLGPNGEWIDNSTSLIKAFLDPVGFLRGSELSPEAAAGEVLRGMTRQQGNDIDEFVTGALHNNLVGLPLDLGAINIARARELGMPRFNQVRRELYEASNQDARLTPYGSWAEFAAALKHPESIYNFVAAYGTHTLITSQTTDAGKRAAAIFLIDGELAQFVENRVVKTLAGQLLPTDQERSAFYNGTGNFAEDKGGLELVDFWIGGLAEKGLAANDMLGSSFAYVFENQLERLQAADRHYYLARLTGNLLTQIEQTSFAAMAQRNVEANHLPGNIFATPTWSLEVDQRFQHTGLGTGVWANKEDPTGQVGALPLVSRTVTGNLEQRAGITAGHVLIYNGEDHVVLGGTEQNDLLRAGNGDDTIYGDGGDDIIYTGGGDDEANGGSGDDIIFDGGAGAAGDVIRGGDGHDVVTLSAGLAFVFGGDGNDMVIGAASSAEVFGNAGTDFILLGNGGGLAAGGAGDDWVEGGRGGDDALGEDGRGVLPELLPQQTGGQEIGHDVVVLGDGQDRADGELGNDIFIDGAGDDRYFGDVGFDWVVFGRDTSARNLNLGKVAAINEAPGAALGDRFDGQIEAMSGTRFNDSILGDNRDDLGAVDAAGVDLPLNNRLTENHFAQISGLYSASPADGALFNDILLANSELFTTQDGGRALSFGNILLGGGGGDTIQGNGGNDIIDGDLELTVQIEWRPDPLDSTTWKRFDSVAQLQAAATNRVVNPGDLHIVRELRSAPGNNAGDVAVFRGAFQEYDIEGITWDPLVNPNRDLTVGTTFVGLSGTASDLDGDGYIRIAHNANFVVGGALGATFDGVDYVRNVESLSFADPTILGGRLELSETLGFTGDNVTNPNVRLAPTQSTLNSGFDNQTASEPVVERITFQQTGIPGGIGLAFSTVESVGTFGLETDQNGGIWITDTKTLNRLKLTYLGQQATTSQMAGWTPVGVRSITDPEAAFEVIWNSQNSFGTWKVNKMGAYISESGLTGFQVMERESLFAQDLNGVGGITPTVNTVISVFGGLNSSGPALGIDSLNRYTIQEVGKNDVTLKFNWGGTKGIEECDSSTMADWSAMAVTQLAGSPTKTVLWKNSSGSYGTWEIDDNGVHLSSKALSNYEVASLESAFGIDLNANSFIGPYLGQDAGGYTLGLTDKLYYNGSQVSPTSFPGWTAIAAGATAVGNQVAWRSSSGALGIWNTDLDGNFQSSFAVNSVQIGAFENLFAEDLNGAGGIDTLKTIEAYGTTSVLADVNGGYYLSSTRGVQLLQINGQQMRENIGGGWNVVGAEDTLTGFQVVWENASTGTFAYWNADSNGNYLNAKVINSFQLKSFETSFQQDLDNFNGIDSLTQAGTTGNASLLMQANNGYVIDGANGIQFLNYQGSQITPGFSTDWTLNGVSNQGSGYVAHWTRNSDALSAYWLTNSTGDFLSSGLA